MAGRFKVGRLAPLLLLIIACSSASDNTANERQQPVCGNGVIEPGEQCDFPLVATCTQLTGNPASTGVVQCIACQHNTSMCQLGPNPGMGGMNGGSGFPANGGFPSNGGVPAGGLTGQGGIPVMGGAPPFGGFPSNGGDLGTGGFPGDGGFPGNGGFPSNGGFVATGGDPGNGGTPATGGGSTTGPLGDVNALRQACVDTINQYRSTLSLPPMTRASPSVETCSDTGAQSDATTGVAHGSSGDCPGMSAQDTCPGWNPTQYGGVENALKACLQAMWAEGEPPEGRDKCIQDYFAGNRACFLAHGHYLNMSGTNPVLSCGFYSMPNGRVWMNQDFGR